MRTSTEELEFDSINLLVLVKHSCASSDLLLANTFTNKTKLHQQKRHFIFAVHSLASFPQCVRTKLNYAHKIGTQYVIKKCRKLKTQKSLPVDLNCMKVFLQQWRN